MNLRPGVTLVSWTERGPATCVSTAPARVRCHSYRGDGATQWVQSRSTSPSPGVTWRLTCASANAPECRENRMFELTSSPFEPSVPMSLLIGVPAAVEENRG